MCSFDRAKVVTLRRNLFDLSAWPMNSCQNQLVPTKTPWTMPGLEHEGVSSVEFLCMTLWVVVAMAKTCRHCNVVLSVSKTLRTLLAHHHVIGKQEFEGLPKTHPKIEALSWFASRLEILAVCTRRKNKEM